MKVRATQPGYFRRLHKVGDEFEVSEKQFSKTWMEKVVSKPKKQEAAAKADEKQD